MTIINISPTNVDALSFRQQSPAFEIAGFGLEVRPAQQAIDVTRATGTSTVSPEAATLMGRILGEPVAGTPAATFTRISSWDDLTRVVPGFDPVNNPDHQALMNQLNETPPVGAAIDIDGRSYAFVNMSYVPAMAELTGMTDEQLVNVIGAQEALHAELNARLDGTGGTRAITQQDNEVLAEYSSIVLGGDAFTNLSLMRTVEQADEAGYSGITQMATTAMGEALAGNRATGGLSAQDAAGEFVQTLADYANVPANQAKPVEERLLGAIDQYLADNGLTGQVEPDALLADMRSELARISRAEATALRSTYGLGQNSLMPLP